MKKLYQEFAVKIQARKSCMESNNKDWSSKHTEDLLKLEKEFLPSGSGFDNGTVIDLDASNSEKLVFHTQYHHMNENGFYVGWTTHKIIVTPSLIMGFKIRVSGKNRKGIKEYIGEMFYDILNQEIFPTDY